MDPVTIAALSVPCIVILVYLGMYIPVALGLVSFVSVWLIKGNYILAFNFLKIEVGHGVSEEAFATIPLFTLMGLLVSRAGMGRDIYDVMNFVFQKITAGVGIATVGANAIFAAVTGSSIASASVFTKVSVPEMLRLNYNPRFAVGVVAGSSVLGMIIPPSAMLIIYSFVAEQSVGHMFIAGIIPGLILTVAYIVAIILMGQFWPSFVGENSRHVEPVSMGFAEFVWKTLPIAALIVIVLGGIYTGKMTAVESGAVGALLAFFIMIARGLVTSDTFKLSHLWETLVETGYITASILFLITMASFYGRMLGFAGLPQHLEMLLQTYNLSFFHVMVIYVLLMLVLGTLLDTASIILIVVPLFMALVEGMGMSLVWFGIVTVIGAEIGLLTPPLGISCFVIKATLNNPDIKLKDVFLGALPFAFIMLLVLILLINYPVLSTVLIN